MYKRSPENLIYLNTKDKRWSQYSYQFAHEYCHHLIESDFINSFDQFGWFEESLCELASIHSIKNMAHVWQTKPPYDNWREYSESLDEYAEEVLNRKSNNIDIPLSTWIVENLENLSKDRYQREKNCLVATNLFDLFQKTPTLWNTVTCINKIEINEQMNFQEFLDAWENLITDDGKESWLELKNRLLN